MYKVRIHLAISCSVEYFVPGLSYLVYALCSQIQKKYVARELILNSKTCHPSAIRVIYDIMIHTYLGRASRTKHQTIFQKTETI
jgi:lysine/ornithine N-monooxygenase